MLSNRKVFPSVYWFSIAMLLIGFISRLAPLFDADGRLLQQFVTEDGYLMLTIARNISLGLGMTTSEGTIATNGTQPFVTFVWALGYWLIGSDKVYGVVFAHLIQIAVSVLSAFFLFRLARRVLDYSPLNEYAALILSALFFSSPHILPHTMNFLETGTYLLAIILVISVFYESDDAAKNVWGFGKSVAVGCLLGWMFWVRIDSAFVILAACISYIYRGIPFGKQHILRRIYNTLIFGTTSVIVGSPWLANNYLNFGSLTPISGQAQAAEKFAENLDVVPSILAEYLSIIVPIPNTLQDATPIIGASLVMIFAGFGALFYIFKRSSHRNRSLIVMGLISSLCFISYYGLLFGAGHFMARYLATLAPFLCLFTTCCALHIYSEWPQIARLISPFIAALFVMLTAGLQYRIYQKGMTHQHFQVINWVQQHVPEETWIGAVQTGTLGYFHDRTINLDGKVNPEALAARQRKKYCPPTNENQPSDCLMHYIVERKLWYLVDWIGISKWADIPPIDKYFTLVVFDKQKNLAVLKRHGAPAKSQNTIGE